MQHIIWLVLWSFFLILDVVILYMDFIVDPSKQDTWSYLTVFLTAMALFFVYVHAHALITGEENGW
jgi:hypothetical protein